MSGLRGYAPSVVLICVGSMSAKVSGLCGRPFAPTRADAGVGKAPDPVVVVVGVARRELVGDPAAGRVDRRSGSSSAVESSARA